MDQTSWEVTFSLLREEMGTFCVAERTVCVREFNHEGQWLVSHVAQRFCFHFILGPCSPLVECIPSVHESLVSFLDSVIPVLRR